MGKKLSRCDGKEKLTEKQWDDFCDAARLAVKLKNEQAAKSEGEK